jgi:aldehyde dehydrogenase (NAD+)
MEPTLLLNPPLDSDIMTEEIFGPLLPIITVRASTSLPWMIRSEC